MKKILVDLVPFLTSMCMYSLWSKYRLYRPRLIWQIARTVVRISIRAYWSINRCIGQYRLIQLDDVGGQQATILSHSYYDPYQGYHSMGIRRQGQYFHLYPHHAEHSNNHQNQAQTFNMPIQDLVHDISNLCEWFMIFHLYYVPCGKLLIWI